MGSLTKVILTLGVLLIGAASWIVAERLRIIDPMCVMSSDAYTEIEQNGRLRK